MVDKNVFIGKQTNISRSILNTFRGKGKIIIGNNTFIYESCQLFAHRDTVITVGNNVLMAGKTTIMTQDHRFMDGNRLIREQDTVEGDVHIGNDVWIGYDAKILQGVTIGDGCVIGTGAVVTRDIAPYSVAVGVPARVIRKRVFHS